MFPFFLSSRKEQLTFAMQSEICAVHHFFGPCVAVADIAVFKSQHIALTTPYQRYITQSLTEYVTPGLTLSLMAAPFLKL